MASKPKKPKAAIKSEIKGKAQPEPSPECESGDLTSASDSTEDTVALAATDSHISDTEASASTVDAGPPEHEADAEASVPGAILAQAVPDALSAAPPPRTPSTVGLVFGGLIAGAIGFLAATFLPNPWGGQSVDAVATLSTSLDAQTARIDGVAGQVEALAESGISDIAPLSDKIAELSGRLDDLTPGMDQIGQQLDQLVSRIETLEARPIIGLPDGSDAMAAQLDAFRSELDAVTNAARAEVEGAMARAAEVEADAAAIAADARRRAALAEIEAALENGAPFASVLTTLDEAPDDLAAVADDGAPTLASLRATFPELARAALVSAEDLPENAGAGEKLASFLRRQTNARSLSPRDGGDVDAILSRAEAWLQDGELRDALGELKALPKAPSAVFAPWITEAEARVAAVSAFAAMSEILN